MIQNQILVQQLRNVAVSILTLVAKKRKTEEDFSIGFNK